MTDAPPLQPLALVAGASGAIGAAVLDRLKRAGWKILATYRDRPPTSSANVHWIRFDGGDDEHVDDLRGTLDRIPGRLRCVICCIGAPSSKNLVANTSADEFAAVYSDNVISVARLWHVIAPRARDGDAGMVVLSSGTTTQLGPGNGAYSMAKAALEALCVTLAKEEAQHSVRVNIVAPSLVSSPLAEHVLKLKGVSDTNGYYQTLPWGRALSPHEVAAVAVDIATAPQWRYMSAQIVRLAFGSGQ